eukprot:m.147169 g.147169  ORF g.147169 m.147169 type:complete len:355 (+) comp16822_c0_seq1:1294-2358(+)
MFHGGTNFGFMNGANVGGKNAYKPTITSYDYDAPLSEQGKRTAKYQRLRESLLAFHQAQGDSTPIPEPEDDIPTCTYEQIAFRRTRSLSVFDILETPALLKSLGVKVTDTLEPRTFEDPEVGQAYGYILYRAYVDASHSKSLVIDGLADRAHVFANGQLLGVYDRWVAGRTIHINLPVDLDGNIELDIFVENCGRVNFGAAPLIDRKGITSVMLGEMVVRGWMMFSFDMSEAFMQKVSLAVEASETQPLARKKGGARPSEPAFYSAVLEVPPPLQQQATPCDTFVRANKMGRGAVFVNNFNLGRFDSSGPQATLYLPGPLLRSGANTITVFALDVFPQHLDFTDRPELGVPVLH